MEMENDEDDEREQVEMAFEHDCQYTPTIMDGPVIRFGFGYSSGRSRRMFEKEDREEFSAEISASRNGVSLQGTFPIYSEREDIEKLKRLLEWAWNAHVAIGARGDHDAAKKWVETHNASLVEIVNALRAVTAEHGVSLDGIEELR